MTELFRLKIAAKRQCTIPQRMMQALQLSEGDELRVTVEDGRILKAQAYAMAPSEIFTPELVAELAAREKTVRYGMMLEDIRNNLRRQVSEQLAKKKVPAAKAAGLTEDLLREMFEQSLPQQVGSLEKT